MAWRRTRRFKRRGPIWLPTLGTDTTTQSGAREFDGAGLEFSLTGTGADWVVSEGDITYDFPTQEIIQSQGTTVTTLADQEGSSWRLRRLVGKVFASFITSDDTLAPFAALFGCGFLVTKVNRETGAPLNLNIQNYNPLITGTVRWPWIWRRCWALGLNERVSGAPYNFPSNIAAYGSIQDGGHIDAKTNRILKEDERLFVYFASHALPLSGSTPNGYTIQGYLDTRLLGNLTKTSNRGNASR